MQNGPKYACHKGVAIKLVPRRTVRSLGGGGVDQMK